MQDQSVSGDTSYSGEPRDVRLLKLMEVVLIPEGLPRLAVPLGRDVKAALCSQGLRQEGLVGFGQDTHMRSSQQ